MCKTQNYHVWPVPYTPFNKKKFSNMLRLAYILPNFIESTEVTCMQLLKLVFQPNKKF